MVKVEDERRRQKKQFNKTEDRTKFLDAPQISEDRPQPDSRSVDPPAREMRLPRPTLFTPQPYSRVSSPESEE